MKDNFYGHAYSGRSRGMIHTPRPDDHGLNLWGRLIMTEDLQYTWNYMAKKINNWGKSVVVPIDNHGIYVCHVWTEAGRRIYKDE